MAIEEYLQARRDFFNSRLAGYLPPAASCPKILLEAMEYSLFAGGKRLRPILVFAAAEECGGDWKAAMPAAAALEMVHTYSLIHDDLPAMDDDDLRRGRPSCHKAWGEGIAILAGDGLLTHAFTVLAQAAFSGDKRLALVAELAEAAGPSGMVAGQALDITGAGAGDPAFLHRVHGAKTGALFRAALRLGAISAGAPEGTLRGLSVYADHLGLAYQVVDDILDVTAASSCLGKHPGSDSRKDKASFATAYGLERSREIADAEILAAQAALAPLAGSFMLLTELASHIGARSS